MLSTAISKKRSRDHDSKDWSKDFSQTYNQFYWYNCISGESKWDDDDIDESKSEWMKILSNSKNKYYWFNKNNGTCIWEDPSNFNEIMEMIEQERNDGLYHDDPKCPRCIDSTDINDLVSKLRKETSIVLNGISSYGTYYETVFKLSNDDTAMITRAIQEDQILKTQLKLKKDNIVVLLPSFWEVWSRPDGLLAKEILRSKDPNEAKWSLMKKYEYKLATTFMVYNKKLFL